MSKKSFAQVLFKSFPLTHIPSLFLIIGYPAFWLEMYFLSPGPGKTSVLALSIFCLFVISILWIQQNHLSRARHYLKRDLGSLTFSTKCFMLFCTAISLFILLISFRAALFPVHLPQEYDALNYHYTIPRQHLILHSFQHIPWSSADLFPLPVQFALSPYWFLTDLPNKMPQFIFLLGLVVVSVRLLLHFRQGMIAATLLTIAILGTHGFGIQMGTGMLDLVLTYLFIATLDSLLNGYWILAAIEFCFYFWSKSFMPLEMIVLIGLLFGIYFVFKLMHKHDIRLSLGSFDPWFRIYKVKNILKKSFGAFLILSLCVGAPFVVKSLQKAATPLYPFFVGKLPGLYQGDMTSREWKSSADSANTHLTTKDQYGVRKEAIGFLKHFWLLAVPEQGVNNRFDYPLGLTYLAFIVPFLFLWIRSWRERRFSILGWLVILHWALWWFGSQQSRFLFVPLVLIYLLVIIEIQSYSFILWTVLLCALMLNALSVYRAHKSDLGIKNTEDVLREKDIELLRLNKWYIETGQKGIVPVEFHDAAFARFPISVPIEHLPYVLWTDSGNSK
jgi:hypothetical protein